MKHIVVVFNHDDLALFGDLDPVLLQYLAGLGLKTFRELFIGPNFGQNLRVFLGVGFKAFCIVLTHTCHPFGRWMSERNLPQTKGHQHRVGTNSQEV